MKLKWTVIGFQLVAGGGVVGLAAAPANDDLASRQPITLAGSEVVVLGTNHEATLEPGEPLSYHGAGRSVWYAWTPTRSGPVRLEMQTENFGLWAMTGTQVTNVDWLPMSLYYGRTHSWTYIFEADAGTNYLLRVDGQEAIMPGVGDGPFRFVLAQPGAPANDQFAQRQPLAGRAALVQGDTMAATWEAGEPELPLSELKHSLWWDWTAPSSGLVTILNRGSGQSRIAVYTGASLASLTPVTNNHQPWGAMYSISFPATAEVKYVISLTSPAHERGQMGFFLTLDGAAWMDAPVRNPQGQLEFDFWGITGETYELEISSDLSHWQPAGIYYGAYGAARLAIEAPAGENIYARLRRP